MENIIVLGSINMDLVTVVDRKPLDGETITGKEFFQVGGGKGANQAVSIAKLGGKVKFLGMVGEDFYGAELLGHIKNQGVDITRVEKAKTSTGLATIILDNKGENSIIVIPGANGKVNRSYIDKNKDIFDKGEILLCQLEVPYETVKYAFEQAKERGIKTILNPAPATRNIDELLKLSDIVVCNETEFNIISGVKTENSQEIIEKSKILLDKGVKELIVTLGSKGVIYINEKEHKKYHAYKVTAIDTTAAGDSFIGGFTAFLHEGIDKAIDIGMKAGAIAVTRKGAQSSLANLEEVMSLISNKKIIYDCDTGMDDAIAIATITAVNEFEIMGICCVGGNVELRKTTQNTLDVLEFLGKDIKVYGGEAKPLERALEVAYDYHGESGIGEIVLPRAKNLLQEKNAVDFMHETIMENKGEIHLIATGPSTNVAKLLLTYPEVKEHIASITFMGGGIKEGNVTAHAEFNAYCDPEACKIIVNSEVPVTMVGLDATMKSKLYREDMYFLEDTQTSNGKLTKMFYQGMLNVRGNLGIDYAVFHDSIAVLSLIKEDMFVFENLNLDVDLSEEKLGKTYVSDWGKSVRVAMNFDKYKFLEFMREIF